MQIGSRGPWDVIDDAECPRRAGMLTRRADGSLSRRCAARAVKRRDAEQARSAVCGQVGA
jgi:hypothetical protein